MIDRSGSKLRLAQLKTVLNKWRVAFLIFALLYAVLILLNLSNLPMQWDEVTHLNGGLFLKYGFYDKFVNNMFYPPLFDSVTMIFYDFLGISLVSARLVSAVFSILSLWAVFELASSMYDGKTAFLSVVLLGIMPGYFWLSRTAMLETMLVFFTVMSILFFFRWLQYRQDKMLVFSGLAVGLGFLTKYQAIVIVAILVLSILFLARNQLKRVFTKFTITLVAAMLIVTPWIVIAYEYTTKTFGQWMYALSMGNPERFLYSSRYPVPIFYLIEMTWPYNDIHPISLFLYIIYLFGLGLLAWRHQKGDKLVLTWFASIFIFFTLIENKEWRYIMPLFPALAISAAVLILFIYSKAEIAWKKQNSVNKKHAAKFAAGLFAVLVIGAMAYSINDAYYGVAKYNIQIDIEAATKYAMAQADANNSIMILCPFNFFSKDMVNFYLWKDGENQINTYQYPRYPVDTYTPSFNITEFVGICKQNKVKYVFTYENGGTVPYFNTTLNLQQIYMQLYASGNFSKISPEATFGANPRRIFILNFIG
jgi:4-amino-4-deoxy-L-arabinose transferase-like glycosyltransferase